MDKRKGIFMFIKRKVVFISEITDENYSGFLEKFGNSSKDIILNILMECDTIAIVVTYTDTGIERMYKGLKYGDYIPYGTVLVRYRSDDKLCWRDTTTYNKRFEIKSLDDYNKEYEEYTKL
jgi:hypothetical protein